MYGFSLSNQFFLSLFDVSNMFLS